MQTHTCDVVVIGAGAAGLMCAHTAGYRGRQVVVLDHANKAGKKILMSGGGRCNFTNLNSTPANFLSSNPGFCISALKRYRPEHFLELVERHGVAWVEKAPGQLFCQNSSRDILDLLLQECEWAGVEIRLNTAIDQVQRGDSGWRVTSGQQCWQCQSLVIASGGLSIPTMGASNFGYRIAEQFGLSVLPVRAALVPFTLQPQDKTWLAPLSGLSCDVTVSAGGTCFREPLLVTHRGLSGPAILQASSYWQPGEAVHIDLLPDEADLAATLMALRQAHPQQSLSAWLAERLPRRLAQALCQQYDWVGPLQGFGNARLMQVAGQLKQWPLKPAGTEGYRTAEVTLGGVDTRQFSSRTFEAAGVPGLFMIGEVLDVTGQLGGHNFQWAWASGHCAGEAV